MKRYARNSPEALARILVMTMITDARLDDRELEIMDRLQLYAVLDLDPAAFHQVVKDYCDDLVRGGAPDGRIDLMDRTRIDEVIDLVDDPDRRRVVAQMVLQIIRADGTLHVAELALFRHLLARWGMDLNALVGPAGP